MQQTSNVEEESFLFSFITKVHCMSYISVSIVPPYQILHMYSLIDMYLYGCF